MAEKMDCVFSVISPWAYIGHTLFVDTVRHYGCEITFRPVNLLTVFSETGGLPLGKRHPSRQKYRWFELQRWLEIRKIPFNLKPQHWPFNFMLADKVIVSAIDLGHEPANLILRIMEGIWVNDRDLASRDTLLATIRECGFPAEQILEHAESQKVSDLYAQNTGTAIENGCFGSPTYWLKGEMYFGQDRIEQLADALRSGREPYKLLD